MPERATLCVDIRPHVGIANVFWSHIKMEGFTSVSRAFPGHTSKWRDSRWHRKCLLVAYQNGELCMKGGAVHCCLSVHGEFYLPRREEGDVVHCRLVRGEFYQPHRSTTANFLMTVAGAPGLPRGLTSSNDSRNWFFVQSDGQCAWIKWTKLTASIVRSGSVQRPRSHCGGALLWINV